MKIPQGLDAMRGAIRLRHLARSTEACYWGWVQSLSGWLSSRKITGTSAQKVEAPHHAGAAGFSTDRQGLEGSLCSMMGNR